MKKFLLFLGILFLIYLIGINTVPQYIESERNPVKALGPYQISPEAQAMYARLDFISDLNCDALLWGRDLNKRGDRGHVDFPRMRESHVALEMFTIVSKSPSGQNMQSINEDAFDITGLPLIVEGLMNTGFTKEEIRAVMGENVKCFFLKNLK